MKKIAISLIAMMCLACFGHQTTKRESLNWRCYACHTAYKRITIYEWRERYRWNGQYWIGGWVVRSQTKCPKCGR